MPWENPYGYGDQLPLKRSDVSTAGLMLTKWTANVLRIAEGNLLFAKSLGLTQSQDSFGLGQGATFTIPIFDWPTDDEIATAATPLTVGTSIELGTQTMTSVVMTLKEYGFGYSWESMIDYITNVNMRGQIDLSAASKLRRVLNYLFSKIYYESPWQMIAREGLSAGSFEFGSAIVDLTGTCGTGELTHGMIDFAYDKLTTSRAKPSDSGLYMAIAHPASLRSIKATTKFENRDLYTKKGVKGVYQILGEYNGFVWAESTESVYKGTTIFFGKDVGGYGFGLQPDAYYYADWMSDAGRVRAIKTRFIMGHGQTLRDTATNCIVCLTGTDVGEEGYYDY